MGLDNRRPPLPAPTETSNDEDTEVNTQFSGRTTYVPDDGISLPPDGRPITISTQKVTATREGGIGRHGRNKSQTSLLIEYFEASKSGDKSRTRPSVRVKVTPSAHKKSRSGNEAIQITGIGSDRKPSYTRRISLGNFNSNNTKAAEGAEGTELSHSSESNVSGRSPLEIEVLNNESDISAYRSSRGLNYAPVESNVSSMPPDSMLEGEGNNDIDMSRAMEKDDGGRDDGVAYLKAPVRTGSQNRSDSRERLTQKVMEKLGASSSKPRKSSRTGHERASKEHDSGSRERRRKSSRSRRSEDDTVSGAESSLLSSQFAASDHSYRSGTSQASRMTNNPKLLEMVEDTIKRMILPEINAIKEDQKTDRKLRNSSDSRRGSVQTEDEKGSSSPKIASKPKVVLNRDGDDPGVVLSRGDSERVKHRKSSRDGHSEKRPSSSRRSSGHSRRESYDGEEKLRPRPSRSSNGLRGAAAVGLAGGALTAAALRHHDSQGDMHERRKKRSKSRSSRSRSASITEKADEAYFKKNIPPMPLGSNINDSDTTRESLLSRGTEQPTSDASPGQTPTREVSRDPYGASTSPTSSRTVTGMSRGLGMSHSNHSIDGSHSPNGSVSNKARVAALAAAGLGGIAVAKGTRDSHMDADGYGSPTTQRKISSPVQSISSLKKNFEDEEPLVPQALRPRSPASRSSVGRLRSSKNSQISLRSVESSPTTKLSRSRQQSHKDSLEDFATPAERPESGYLRESGTPGAETADEWFERQHLVNDRYRDSLGATTNRDSYQTNPYPQDEKRYTMNTDESYDRQMDDAEYEANKDVRDVGQNMNYVHTPVGVESAVASLMEPSTVSSQVLSSNDSPGKANGTYSDRMAEHLRAMGKDNKPAIYEGSTLSQTIPSQDRWAAIRGQAVRSVENVDASPQQSPARSLRQEGIENKPTMVSSGLPLADDPMPEIGHYDSQSDLTTNPSIIHGPLGGDATGKDTWPYTPDPPASAANRDSRSIKSGQSKGEIFSAGAAAAGGAAALAAAHAAHQPTVENDREQTPTGNSPAFRDEGYVTDGRTRSVGGITPRPDQVYGKKDMEEYNRAMDAHDLGGEDPFAPAQHTRNISGNSHGMASPLYDSSTGKGIDRIQSHDVVALMDHLTVRDAQRNARDTEILVTLVRSAAEMRQSFDEIKKFITEQDKLIMQTTDRNAEYTAQRVLSGPRPQPLGSPRTPRRATESEEDVQTKRKGVLRRALKGLTGGKSAKDLARIEDMLMQILDNVEDLKHQNGGRPMLERSYTEDSLDSYEKLRAAPDSGYEPEGQAGTSSTPSHSGHFAAAPPREKHQFHSGYDGRPGSVNRVSTVAEDDEDELEPHEHLVLSHQFENNERLLTPTQELNRTRGISPSGTPPRHAATFSTPEKQAKHKSNSSSLFGVPVPKISRWSKTTTSSAAPDPAVLDSPKQTRNIRPSSEASRSGSALDQYDDDDQYSVDEDDQLRSTQSLAREQERAGPAETRSMRSQGSRFTRTPSPLIPSEASTNGQYEFYNDERIASPVQEDEEALFDDPKYQAHRNSLLLQHPQPRQGPTPRHQNTLESQAQTFDDLTGTNSDLSQRTVSDFDPAVWGSSGTAGLARHRLTQVEPLSPVSMNSPSGYTNRAGKSRDGPLVPQQQKPPVPPKVNHSPDLSPEPEFEPQFSNSGFSRDGYSYSSPYGSGHLLEPIPEVRMSLETDSGRVSNFLFLLGKRS